MSWVSKIWIGPEHSSFYRTPSSPDNSESQAWVWLSCFEQGYSCLAPSSWVEKWNPQSTGLLDRRISNRFQLPRKWHRLQHSLLVLVGPLRSLIFSLERGHGKSEVSWAEFSSTEWNNRSSQHLCPLATLQKDKTKHLRIVAKCIMPRMDPEDLRVLEISKVWTKRIKREAESGKCRSTQQVFHQEEAGRVCLKLSWSKTSSRYVCGSYFHWPGARSTAEGIKMPVSSSLERWSSNSWLKLSSMIHKGSLSYLLCNIKKNLKH